MGMEKGNLCHCGSVPEIISTNEKNDETTLWRCVCPHCGSKGALWRKSQTLAQNDWEKVYRNVKPELAPAGAD